MESNAVSSGKDRSETVAFRTSQRRKILIQVAADERGLPQSDWLREVVHRALDQRFGSAPPDPDRED